MKNDFFPLTLSELLQNYTLTDGVRLAELKIRENPTVAAYRHSLFQLLCLLGDWSRSLQQLQICARLDEKHTRDARLFRELIRCEIYRNKVFRGQLRPSFILPQPSWSESLIVALSCEAKNNFQEADNCRFDAMDAITDVSGVWNGGHFDWASDSDSRIGPVLELVTGGAYIWLPLSQIHSLESPLPVRMTDLLWKPVSITLVNGETLGAWLFTRYNGSENAPDALRLCRETTWQDGPGDTSVWALGQKVWLTSHGDISLLNLTDCTFQGLEERDV